MIYLNPAGLSPFHPEVQEEMARTLHAFGQLLFSEAGVRQYRDTLQQCRQVIADWLEVTNEQRIAFMPNATTACCLALSRIAWKAGDTLMTTTHENATILQELRELKERGVDIIALDPDSTGGLVPQLETTLRHTSIRAIVISHISHLDGRIFPLDTIQEFAQAHDILLIVDGAQAVGHIPVSFRQFHPYAYFFPGHKWCAGPMGSGALILGESFEHMGRREKVDMTVRKKTPVDVNRYELGTHNIGVIAGLAKACTLQRQHPPSDQTLKQIREEWKSRLARIPGLRIIEGNEPHAPGILSFACLEPTVEQYMQTAASTHSLAWKTFTHPSFPSCLSIRVSWTTGTPTPNLSAALSLLTPP